MNDRLEHELSQFLDGRLPSGRREQLLERIAEDPEAARLLEEMEQAQALAQSLSMPRVGRSFSESLWQRIRSGEGTPEAVFREPLPLWTKARYVASGALAAAAMIAAVHLLTGNEATDPRSPESAGRTTEVASADADPQPDSARRLRPVENPLSAPVFTRITPAAVAQAGQFECVQAVSDLQDHAPRIQERLPAAEPRAIVVELAPVVGRARGSAHLIRWMQQEKLVTLPTEFDTTLALTERILKRLERANAENDVVQLQVAVQDLRELDVARLRTQFTLACCTPPQQFLAELRDQIYRNPEVGRALRVVFTVDNGMPMAHVRMIRIEPVGGEPFGVDPLGEALLMLRSLPEIVPNRGR